MQLHGTIRTNFQLRGPAIHRNSAQNVRAAAPEKKTERKRAGLFGVPQYHTFACRMGSHSKSVSGKKINEENWVSGDVQPKT